MKIEQTSWSDEKQAWTIAPPWPLAESAQLVLLFGSRSLLKNGARLGELRQAYRNAHFLGCSTAGEICGKEVRDQTLVATAVHLEHTVVVGAKINTRDVSDSFQAGQKLAQALEVKDLIHVFVLSDGLKVNGSELVKGLTKALPSHVSITGGLAGDGAAFGETLVLWDEDMQPGMIAAIGFYGNRIKIGYGTLAGWDPFGIERLITKSRGNVLYELDGKSALALYKKYLGEHAAGLPATGLLFPLELRSKEGEPGLVRTILAVNEEDQSMTFAGDVPEGSYARFMKANFDRLIDGAAGAAKASQEKTGSQAPDLAVLISCVGRKMVLDQRVEEEVEGVAEVLGSATVLTGFYSYGEICPFAPTARCELHNQTMTITTFREE
ncbi:MAG: FIST N-terminal domain-containing protein [Verrucomicrobiota bacterium]